MNFKNIFIIMIVLFIALGVSAVSAEDIASDDNIIYANSPVAMDTVVSDTSQIGVTDVDSKNATEIIADNVTYKCGDDKDYSVVLLSNGTPLANQNITFVIDDFIETNVTTNENGTAVLDIKILQVGKYVVDVKYAGSENYSASTTQAEINVFNTIVVEDLTKYYANSSNLVATFYNENGSPLVNGNVSVFINNKNYYRNTTANGTLEFPIYLASGVYNVPVTNHVTNETVNVTITVLPVISGENIVLYYANGTSYVANFINGEGNPLVGASVQFNINGVIYNRTTNENGSASLGIYLRPNNYTITAINPANNAFWSNNITVLPVISGENIKLYFANGTSYVANFLDGEGNPLVNASVRFNVNGVFYNKTTNENGSASLGIYLRPNNYTITAINPANNAFWSNNITVLPTIIASDFTTKYQSGGEFKFTVVDGHGTPLANQTAKLNINGKVYERTTNANGSASLAIYLLPNTYTCTVEANGLFQSFKITVSKLSANVTLLSTTVKTGDKFECKISYDNKPVDGVLVIYLFNGTTPYGAYTDANGIAGVTIGLPAGSYLFYVGIQDNPVYSNVMSATMLTVKS